MVKTTQKWDLFWSAIFSVIVHYGSTISYKSTEADTQSVVKSLPYDEQ